MIAKPTVIQVRVAHVANYLLCRISIQLSKLLYLYMKSTEKNLLRGVWHQTHGLYVFFFINQFPRAPDYTMAAILNFRTNSWRYSKVKVYHRWIAVYTHKKIFTLFTLRCRHCGKLILLQVFHRRCRWRRCCCYRRKSGRLPSSTGLVKLTEPRQ